MQTAKSPNTAWTAGQGRGKGRRCSDRKRLNSNRGEKGEKKSEKSENNDAGSGGPAGARSMRTPTRSVSRIFPTTKDIIGFSKHISTVTTGETRTLVESITLCSYFRFPGLLLSSPDLASGTTRDPQERTVRNTSLDKRDTTGATGRTFSNHADYNTCTNTWRNYLQGGGMVGPRSKLIVTNGVAELVGCNYHGESNPVTISTSWRG